jgi:hypothetical protein
LADVKSLRISLSIKIIDLLLVKVKYGAKVIIKDQLTRVVKNSGEGWI